MKSGNRYYKREIIYVMIFSHQTLYRKNLEKFRINKMCSIFFFPSSFLTE